MAGGVSDRWAGGSTLFAAELNPFLYDKPLAPERLVGRADELAVLVGLVGSGQNVRLSSPRRYGKTTLLRKLQAEADRIGMPSVYVDFSGVLLLDDVTARIDAAYRPLLGPLARRSRGLWRRGRARLNVGVGPLGGELEVDPGGKGVGRYEALKTSLELPRRVRRKRDQRVLVIFDEFQDVLKVSDRLDGVIRSVIQHHLDDATYVFAGSHPGLMNELFSSGERPLYGQARAVTLGPLPDEDLGDFIVSSFDSGERDTTRVIDRFLSMVRGHPQKAMMLAHHLWHVSNRGDDLDAVDIDTAQASVLAELRPAHRHKWRTYDEVRTAALRALAAGDYGIDADTAAGLESAGDIVNLLDDHRPWVIVDPFFEQWIRQGDDLLDRDVHRGKTRTQQGRARDRRSSQRDGRLPHKGLGYHLDPPPPAKKLIDSLEPGDRVVLPRSRSGSRLDMTGRVIGIQQPITPQFGHPVFYVALDEGDIVALGGESLAAAADDGFVRRLLELLSRPVATWDARAILFGGADYDYARQMLDAAAVLRNLSDRAGQGDLSADEHQLYVHSRRTLILEVARVTGWSRASVGKRLDSSLRGRPSELG
jgi:hypothetical protein